MSNTKHPHNPTEQMEPNETTGSTQALIEVPYTNTHPDTKSAVQGIIPMFTVAQIDLLKRTIATGTTDDEFGMFLRQCQRTGLDPFAKQIYVIRRKTYDSATGNYIFKASIETSIDGFRLIAQRSGEYCGQIGAFWCGEDGVWKDVWLGKKPPMASKVGVCRRGFIEPLFGVARFDTYAQKKQNGELNSTWNKMPEVMIAKCAEALALRRAFPQELSGIYTSDEMSMAGEEYQGTPETDKILAKSQEYTDEFIKQTFDEAIIAIEGSQTLKQLVARGEQYSKFSKYTKEMLVKLKETYIRRESELKKPKEEPNVE